MYPKTPGITSAWSDPSPLTQNNGYVRTIGQPELTDLYRLALAVQQGGSFAPLMPELP